MINKEAIDVKEDIEVLMKPNETKDVKEFIKELDERYNKLCHKAYNSFSVSMVVKEGKSFLVFSGVRKESPDEIKKRVAVEEEKEKRNEEAELKTYLRLKKKFGKSNE